MRKLIILVLAMMMLAGCAGFGKWSPGAQAVVDLICAPTADQMADAALMLAALDAAQAAGTIFFPALGIAKASAVLNTIRSGGCFLLSELTEAFKAVDAANASLLQAKGPMRAAAGVPQYASLRKLIK